LELRNCYFWELQVLSQIAMLKFVIISKKLGSTKHGGSLDFHNITNKLKFQVIFALKLLKYDVKNCDNSLLYPIYCLKTMYNKCKNPTADLRCVTFSAIGSTKAALGRGILMESGFWRNL